MTWHMGHMHVFVVLILSRFSPVDGHQGPNSIEKNPTEKPTENPTEKPTEIPYTKKKSKNG